MSFPFVLILGGQGVESRILKDRLQRLGVCDVLQVCDVEKAMWTLRECGGVDILFCEERHRTVEGIHFLKQGARLGLYQLVVFFQSRTSLVNKIAGARISMHGLPFLQCLDIPPRLSDLHRLLQRYRELYASDEEVSPCNFVDFPSEARVRRALTNRELCCWFEPRVELLSGKLASVEVLLRWNHPTKGLLSTSGFLSKIVSFDLVEELFMYSFERTLVVISVLCRECPTVEFSFRLQNSQLRSDSLVEYVRAMLIRHTVPASSLVFELAEDDVTELRPKMRERLHRLRALGCGLVVAEFGAGFSSLKALCELPIKQLKLHPEFAHSLNLPRSRILVSSVLALVRALNVNLIADGVESKRAQDALIGMGCKVGQGYYLAWPMTADGLLQWLQESETVHEEVPAAKTIDRQTHE